MTIPDENKKNNSFDFSEQIMEDLISEGFSGDELSEKFLERSDEIKEALKILLKEADEIAEGKREFYTLKDILPEID